MKVYEIGETITYTSGENTYAAEVTGRNWAFDILLSYIVKHKGVDITVDAVTFRNQFADYGVAK